MADNTQFTSKMLEGLIELYKKNPIQSLALTINEGAAQGVNSFTDTLKKYFTNTDEVIQAKVGIYCEFIGFYTHLMSRCLDAEIGSDDAYEAVRQLGTKITEIATKKIITYDSKLEKSDVLKKLYETLNDSEIIYAKTTSFAGKDAYDESSTVFQFKQRILLIFSEDMDAIKQLEIDASISSSYLGFMVVVEFSEWVKGPIAQLGYKRYDSVKLIDDERQERIANFYK